MAARKKNAAIEEIAPATEGSDAATEELAPTPKRKTAATKLKSAATETESAAPETTSTGEIPVTAAEAAAARDEIAPVPDAAKETAELRQEWGEEADAETQATSGESEIPIESKAIRLARVAESASVCVACGLSKTRAHVVFGEGNPEAPLMLIGEGPGQNEDATGRPFVGRSGILLDQCLNENGIKRKHVYLANVLRCRACILEAGRLKNRPPTPEETRACAPWLEQTIEIVQPLVILCLGAPAASAMIHKGFKMTQERGQWFESKYARYAMAAWHPAYILRLEGEAYEAARRDFINDIAAARQKVIEARREPKMTLF